MKPGKQLAVIAAAKARAAAGAASTRTQEAALLPHELHGRSDEKKGSHRGVAIRLGALDGRRLLRAATPTRQGQRRSAAPRSQSSQIDDLGQDDWYMAKLANQQEALKVAAGAGSRSMGDSSGQQEGNNGGGSKHQGEGPSTALQAARSWHRQPQPQQEAEQAAALSRRLFDAASSTGTGTGPSRQQLLAELAAQYRQHAASPPGGGLQAVRQHLVSVAPLLASEEQVSAFASSLNCLMPLLLLNLQRQRPPSLLGLAVAKATALCERSLSPAIATPPTSGWGNAL